SRAAISPPLPSACSTRRSRAESRRATSRGDASCARPARARPPWNTRRRALLASPPPGRSASDMPSSAARRLGNGREHVNCAAGGAGARVGAARGWGGGPAGGPAPAAGPGGGAGARAGGAGGGGGRRGGGGWSGPGGGAWGGGGGGGARVQGEGRPDNLRPRA